MVKSKFLEKYKEEARTEIAKKGTEKKTKETKGGGGGDEGGIETRGRPKGSGPELEDSGGWCLHENKTVITVKNRVTGVKTVHINGLEVSQR